MTSLPTTTLASSTELARRLARALLADASLAEDVAQETVLAWWRRPPDRLSRSWIRRVASRVAGRIRREEQIRRLGEESVGPLAHAGTTVDVVARAELMQLLLERLMALPEHYRDALLLRHLEELPLLRQAAPTSSHT